ncbi:hypothetical protein HELRODRAFT_145739, partial [Helobdella robusta]|uniref:ubiquitinyl hydrolase 1 n=1 Tax=Helobdella robusta TaxID=6412 RepID=T1EJM6_HELRO
QLSGEDAWHCPNCRAFQQGTTKSLTLWSLPEILVIHLKRFRQDHEHHSKLNNLIMFPITGLDLNYHMRATNAATISATSSISNSWNAAMLQQLKGKNHQQNNSWLSWRLNGKASADDSVYDLYAVCNHYGDMQGGHYTAFCKNPATGMWCLFNDSKATPIKEEEVVTRSAYLLFYQKRVT